MSKRKPRKRLTIKEIKAKGYSKAYEARLIRGARKGKTRQQARGKPKAEHKVRKEREKIRLGGLTGEQIKIIIRWVKEKFNPQGYREVPTEEQLVEWARANGYQEFKVYRATWEAARKVYKREQADGTYESRGLGYLYQLQGLTKLDNYEWLYYH